MSEISHEEKKKVLLRALDDGLTMILLDARRPGVLVPDSLKSEFNLRLNLSLRFQPQDLTVNEWGVRETLSFSGQPFACGIPWSAIWAVFNHRTNDLFSFPDDFPKELLGTLTEAGGAATESASAPEKKKAKPKLRKVVDNAPATEVADEKAPEVSPAPSRSHLRVIK